MIELLLSKNELIAAFAGLGLSVLLLLWLLLSPRMDRVPISRRRPGVRDSTSLLSRMTSTAVSGIDRILAVRGGSLDHQLELAGLKIKSSEYVIYVATGSIIGLAIGILSGSLILSLLLIFVPIVLGFILVRSLISRRRAMFAKQLDETAQMLAGSLRSGYSFVQAMSMVAKEADQPTAEEFTRITNELRVGRPFDESMQISAQRMLSDDFSWIAQAVGINREVGGNLADVLEGVALTIRERAELQRQVIALSAEGRLSAYILMGLPFVVGGFIAFSNPAYVGRLTTTFIGWCMLAAGAVLLVIGAFWLGKTVKIKY